MKDANETVKCCGKVYSIEAWRLAYQYITDHKAPDIRFERKMKGLGVSRSDAYELYRAQLHEPWEISFSKPASARSGLQILVDVDERMPTQKVRKR